MGVKVEGVRADERVAVADTTARNRKMLIGGAVAVVVIAVVAVVVVQAVKPVPSYGPVGHQFQVSYAGSPSQAGQLQIGQFQSANGLAGVESWRYANSSVTETVQIGNFPPNDPFLIDNSAATNLLLQEVPGSHAVTISGLTGVEASTTTNYNSGITAAFPYTETAVLLQGDTQFVIAASGTSQSQVSAFVSSFKTTG